MMYFVMHVNLVFMSMDLFRDVISSCSFSASLLTILLVFWYKSDGLHGYEAVRTIQVVRASVIFVIALVAIYHSDNIYFDHKDCLY